MAFDFDPEGGCISDGAIRYVMIRPDVLMGVGTALGDTAAFVGALERSAFANARRSFEAYRERGLLDSGNFLSVASDFAGRLGWGVWSVPIDASPDRPIEMDVRASPFAAGQGASDVPVCGTITGVLRALYAVALQREVAVIETHCAAQGHPRCRFTITPGAPAPADAAA